MIPCIEHQTDDFPEDCVDCNDEVLIGQALKDHIEHLRTDLNQRDEAMKLQSAYERQLFY